MSNETSPSKSSFTLLSAVNSQPFIPKQQVILKAPEASKQRSPSTNIDAKPFVPANVNGFSPSGGKKISANAAPYVPTQPSPPRPNHAQGGYQRYPPNKSPEATRMRSRSLSRPELRYPEEYGVMSGGYNNVPRIPSGTLPMAEPSYIMPPVRPMRPAYPQAYPVVREQGPPGMPLQQHGPNRIPVLHPQQRPAENNARNARSRGRGGGQSMPSQAPPYFAGHTTVSNSLPQLARIHQNASMACDQLTSHLQTRQYLIQAQMSSDGLQDYGLPEMLMEYHSLKTLEEPRQKAEALSKALGVSSLVFKGVSIQDGDAYAIRRISWLQVPATVELSQHAEEVIEAWKVVALHPNLSVPCASFVSLDQSSQPAVHIVHAYYPSASTLEAAHLQPQVTVNGLVQMSASEEMVWSYLLQLASAIAAVHSVGLACRAALHSSKVLLLPGGRIRLGSLGVAEIIAGLGARHDDVALLQQEDLRSLGSLLLQLLCGSFTHPSLDHVAAHFSPELTHIVASLTGHSEPFTSSHQLASVLRDRAFTELDGRAAYCNAITGSLAQEVENGRLLRLMVKLTSVLERADMETQWSETGDRYLLKLFRDFAFHHSADDGSPTLDWAHTVECLNKLDAGVPESIVLMSRDEASMLVVTYADVKKCLEGTLNDLRKRSTRPYAGY